MIFPSTEGYYDNLTSTCLHLKCLRSIYVESSSGENDNVPGINIKMQKGRRTLCQLRVLERGKTGTIWWPWGFEGRWSVSAPPPRGTWRMPPHGSATGKQSPQVTTRFLNVQRTYIKENMFVKLFLNIYSFQCCLLILIQLYWKASLGISDDLRPTPHQSEEKEKNKTKRCVSHIVCSIYRTTIYF